MLERRVPAPGLPGGRARPTVAGGPVAGRSRWRDRLALWVPVACALLIGVWGIGRGSMWRDEAATYVLASRPLPQLWHTLGNVDAVHGAFYLLIHALQSAAGGLAPAQVLIRLPSLLATVAAALGVAAVGRATAGPAAGFYAGTAYALTPVVSYYAQEGRSPALVTAAVVLATHLLVRAAGEPRRRRWWAAYAAAVAVACVLNLFAVLVLAAHAVTLLASRANRAVLARWAAAGLLGLLLAVPVAWVAAGQQGQIAWMTRPTWATAGALITRFAGTGLLLVLTLALAVLAVISRKVTAAPGQVSLAALAVPLALVPPTLLLAASQLHPYYQDRYVLYAITGLAWLVGAGLATAGRLIGRATGRQALVGTATSGIVLLLMAVLALPTQAQVRRIDSRSDDSAAAARVVGAAARPGDAVLFLPSVRRVVAEAYPQDFRQVRDVALRVTGAASGTLAGRELSAEKIATALGTAPRVWVISRSYAKARNLTSVEDQGKQLLLREHYRQAQLTRVRGYAVRLYIRRT